MSDDMKARLLAGDITAALDPALHLELLAEPDALWWRDGVRACLRERLRVLRKAVDKVQDCPPPEPDQTPAGYLLSLQRMAPGRRGPVDEALAVVLRLGAAHVDDALEEVVLLREREVLRRMLESEGFDEVTASVSEAKSAGAITFEARWGSFQCRWYVDRPVWDDGALGHRAIVRDVASRFSHELHRARQSLYFTMVKSLQF